MAPSPSSAQAVDAPRRRVANKKMPPPESAQLIRTHTMVLLSFWFIAAFLGLPLWHFTTSIYRAPLPLQEMENWAAGKNCKAEFPLVVDLEARSFKEPAVLLKLLHTAQHVIEDSSSDSAGQKKRHHHLNLRLSPSLHGSPPAGKSDVKEPLPDYPKIPADKPASPNDAATDAAENIACVIRLVPANVAESKFEHSVHSTSRTVDIHYSEKSSLESTNFLNDLASYIGVTLQDIFWQEQQLVEHILQPYSGASPSASSSKSPSDGNLKLPQKRMSEAELARHMSRVVKYAPSYHIAFSLFTATSTPSSWEIESALTSYLSPLLTALSTISNITVSSQVQYYASMTPSVVPTWDENTKSWILKKEELSSFINSAEWPLASISDSPTINFILYVPHPSITPLRIPESVSDGEGFLIPQWGGVVVLNPTEEITKSKHLSADSLHGPLKTFAAQLMALLGASSHPASLPIRLDSLTRQRAAEVIVSASSTLGSLFQIVSSLSSIPIPRTVHDSVEKAMKHLTYACEELGKGRFRKALEMGRVAQEAAEKAFFERTMVAQVYFPDEHRIAVYLPLLGPVGVPLVMAALRELKRVLASRRNARTVAN